jgi:hypothetical protein
VNVSSGTLNISEIGKKSFVIPLLRRWGLEDVEMKTASNSRVLGTIPLLIAVCFCLSGCLEFESIEQPSSILPGETFTVLIEVSVAHEEVEGRPYFGVRLPVGWTIPGDAVACTGVYNEEIIYDPNLTLEQEDLSPAPEGYYWWAGYGEVLSPLYGTSYAEIQIQTDEQTGLFSIDYMLYSTTREPPRNLLNQQRSDNHLIDVVDGYTPRGLRTVVQVDSVMLTWTAPAKTEGLVGYNVYRDGLLLNPNPIVDTTYIDENLAAGVFYYSASSLYENGSEHFTPYEMKGLVFSGGTGEPNEPFRIAIAEQLASIAEFPDLLDKHLVLANDINLDPNLFGGRVFDKAVIPAFSGIFDGNDHTLSHLTIKGKGAWFGLFGELESGAEVKDLAIVDVNITGSGNFIGGLVGRNNGHLTSCYITGTVSGDRYVGGLVGHNHSGSITNCYSTGAISGIQRVGGLVGSNCSSGSVTTSYSNGTVSGDYTVGGLVGDNGGSITNCYSTGTVNGGTENSSIGGLVGGNGCSLVCLDYGCGSITNCYSTGTVNGGTYIGGLAGYNWGGDITMSFWGVETSGPLNMCGREGPYTRVCDDSFGKTTTEMQTASTFLEAGWDFVDEVENGTDDIWWILEGQDYPRLWWELIPEN